MDKRSTFRYLTGLRRGDGEVKRPRADVCRAPTVRRAPGRADSGGKHAPEKIR